MKRVVHITCVHNPFDGRIFYRECVWLAKSGYEVFLIAPAGFQEKTKENVRIIGFKKPESRFKRPFAWLLIVRKLFQLKPDILHFHDPELLVILPFVRLFVRKKMKIVYDVHEYLVDSIQDKYWIPKKLKPAAGFLVRHMESFFGYFVDGQVFVIKEQMGLYSRWKTRKTIVHNYPDLEKFDLPGRIDCKDILKQHKTGRRFFVLVYIGSLYERRGIFTMLAAIKILTAKGFNPLLVLGGIFEDTGFEKKVAIYIAENNIQNHVMITGWIDYTKIKEYLACADAAWLPHLSSEQYTRDSVSTKQLEAMLASLPVVCSRIEPLKRFIDEAGCGLCVDPSDAHEHAEAIMYLCENPEHAKIMGKRGRLLVRTKYNWQNEYKNLYNTMGSGLQF